MRKWPYLMLLLGACSQGDEHPPMLGDCMTCGQAPISAGGGNGGGENDATTGGDAATFDASFDGGNNGDAGNNVDVLQVDVGVGNLDAPFPF